MILRAFTGLSRGRLGFDCWLKLQQTTAEFPKLLRRGLEIRREPRDALNNVPTARSQPSV